MFRKIGFGAAAALTVGILAAGCSDDGDTIILGGSDLRPGAFPGSQVDPHNQADDRRALTPPDETIIEGPEVFWNRANDQAIILYVTSGHNGTDRNLLAHWFDGTIVHPGVQIRGLRGATEAPDRAPVGMKVVWLNTAGNTNANAAARNGDAIITFTRADLAPAVPQGATVHEDQNVRYWGTYFDVSAANAAASGTVVRGFDTVASVLDNDNVIDGGGGQEIGAGANDPAVQSNGFVSDSLVITHSFDGNTNPVISGDPTSYLYFVYGKNQQSGAGANTLNRFRFLPFDLNAATNAMPTAGGTDLAVGAGTYDVTTNQGAAINQAFLVHKNAMFWNSPTVGTTPGDAVVTVTVFSQATPGNVAASFSLGETPISGGTADNTAMPSAANVYGPGHGLSAFYAFYTATGYSTALPPTTAGDRNPDRDLMVTMWPDVATPAPERLEIDAHQGTALLAGTETRTGDRGEVQADSIQTRIDRSGNYISVIWLQDSTDLTTSASTATRQTKVLWGRAVQVRKFVSGALTQSARTLANSVSTAAPVNAPSLGTGVVLNTSTVVPGDVGNVAFQQDLTNGQGLRNCSFQGNHLRMNFIYQQQNDTAATAPIQHQRRLSVNGMVVTLGATDADRPAQALVSATEVVVETADSRWFGASGSAIPDARAVDAGDASRTTGTPPVATTSAGRVIVLFSSNDNNKLDSAVNGQFAERRFYGWRQDASNNTGTVVTLSSNPTAATDDRFQSQGLLGTVVVPVNENTETNPSHVGDTLHIYFREDSTRAGSQDLATRSVNLTQTQPAVGTPVAFGETLVPAATVLEPIFIDNARGGRLLTQGSFETVRNGNTVGVFFDEDRRLYYQQTSGNASGYFSQNGIITPALVDNESAFPVVSYTIETPNRCNDLSRTLAFFRKHVTTTPANVARDQVRVAN